MQKLFDDYFCSNWKSVIDIMTEGLMIVDADGTILFVNQALENLLLYSAEELTGRNCSILECTTCHDTRQQGGDKHCNLFGKGQVKDLRCAFKRKDGSFVEVLKNAKALQDEQGNWVIGVENLTDITAVLDRDREISVLKKQLDMEESFYGLIGTSHRMKQMYQLIQSAASSEAPVTIYGESGTGKELVAGALHQLSHRSAKPFIKVNCAALNENLLESELFGHVKGAFTGAERLRVGRFEAAHQGSIFLDEIADMPLSIQAKLLRVLQEKEIERVGDHTVIPVDARVISASHKNLEELTGREQFRQDLFFRINVIPIHIPPLRKRREDIPLLCKTFTDRLRTRTGKPIEGPAAATMDLFTSYSWPGNVRELINVLEYAFVICPDGLIAPAHLPSYFTSRTAKNQGTQSPRRPGPKQIVGPETIEAALAQAGGKKTRAAAILGVSRVTLWKWIKKMEQSASRGDTPHK